jgi:hypothetical protein
MIFVVGSAFIKAARPGFHPAVDAPLHYPLSVLLKEK